MKPEKHLGFEFAAWYWHFVDVVWLFLFAFVYVTPHLVWGSGAPGAGHLLLGTLLMLLAGALAAGAILLFKTRLLEASLASIFALLSGLAGCAFIAMQWQGDTAFPPGFLNTYLLNGLTRAFLMQVALGFVLLAIPSVLAIAGIVTRERPLGFRFAALNWVVVAVVWVVFYVACHLLPFPLGDEAWNPI
jgi:heme/copper-type cytochrome/quinol oxidase subunit 3